MELDRKMAPPSTKTATKPKNFKNKKNRETKLALVFDPKKRREFLTGFHKRKLQRQQTAKEQLQQQLKLEQKRLRDEAKESFNKLVLSHKRIPELDDFLAKHEVKQEEYDDTAADGDGVTVKVVELNPNEIAFDNNWIGENTFKYQTIKKEVEEEEEDCGNDRDDDVGVKGMELKDELQKTQQSEQKQEKKTFKSKRDIKKLLKKKATQKVKQSRVFQKKNQYERRKQLKKNRVSKRQQEKQEKQNTRKRRK